MKKRKRISCLAAICIIFASFICVNVSAAEAPYQTYVFSYNGKAQITPNAYLPDFKAASFGEAGSLKNPTDIIVDETRNIIMISDSGNNRIVMLNSDFQYIGKIGPFVLSNGSTDNFDNPTGMFVTPDGLLYVADTNKGRIVVFDQNKKLLKIMNAPDQKVLPNNFKYNPISVAVNSAKQIYVVSKNSNMGVIALDENGVFQSFIGAQRVSPNFAELMWRTFMTKEQLERSVSFVPVEYSNLTIDKKGFVYVSCSTINRFDLYQSIAARSAASTYAPIKKVNPAGTDVLRRNGFYPPVGDINFSQYDGTNAVNPSQITKILLLDNGMYMLLDSYGNKLFTYDSAGNLLYAFGGKGEALGLFSQLSSVAVFKNTLLALDSSAGTVTIYKKTQYGSLIDKAIGYQETRQYDKVQTVWKEILGENNNFDLAYLGVGKVLLEQGNYQKAMSYFKLINNKTYYSKAFQLYRQEFMQRYGLWILFGVLLIIILCVWIFGKINRYNKKILNSPSSGKMKDQLLIAFYVIFHPFNGYWALKGEKRGGVQSATVLLIIASVAQLFMNFGAGYLQGGVKTSSITSSLMNLLFPLMLWCISNACFTSLMDGKGKFSDIYVAVCYSTLPVTILLIPCTIISNFMILSELPILMMTLNIAYYWMAALIFFSMITVHDYTLGKNVLVSILTIAGIAFLLFLMFIFVSLVGKMVSLVSSIIIELSVRM